ncbi:uncharacterized protein N7459_005906 [Penicillium hispanicum]|uniref:uncharacterized protein n=1 Tax=Penicillium hispanicum TaxID=1080232 RepID=UPI002540DF65|nr:uncharacterized protein N7459_005906 [Penicillium hispanicum]KAJ5579921.1 hypothetical protein N7459_005906 [Penicillium hispanicum]
MSTWKPGFLPSAMSSGDLSDATSSSHPYTPDSIAKRRRHGEYFHRPPVWFPRSCSHATSMTSQPEDHQPTLGPNPNDQPCVICPSCRAGLSLFALRQSPLLSPSSVAGKENVACASGWEPHVLSDVASTHAGSGEETAVDRDTSLLSPPEKDRPRPSTPSKQNTVDIVSPVTPEHVKNTPLAGCQIPDVFSQPKATLCSRLEYYRDIRCAPGQRWSMQEGSLVIGIDPTLVHTAPDNHLPDKHELRQGKLYVICRMYADMWALCVEVSVDIPSPLNLPVPSLGVNFGFLPLCAVTLAANLGPFMTRCHEYHVSPRTESLFPGNGQCVMAPERAESLHASLQIFRLGRRSVFNLDVPPMVRQAYTNFMLLDRPEADYVPLDSTLEKLFNGIKMGAKDSSILWKTLVRKRMWATFKPSPSNPLTDNFESSTPGSVPRRKPSSLDTSKSRTPSRKLNQLQRALRQQRSSFSVGESFRRIFGKSEVNDDSVTQIMISGSADRLSQ